MAKRSRLAALGLGLSAVLAASATYADSWTQRIKSLEDQQQGLQQQVDRLNRQVSGQGLVNMYQQLTDLQQQVQQLRGDVDELKHQLDETQKRQRDLYVDIDKRLQALESGKGASPPPAAQPNNAGHAGSQAGASAADNQQDATILASYQAALQLLQNARYNDAISALKQFRTKHPDSSYASNALYWEGEAEYAQRDFKAAEQSFQGVIKQYPDSNKVPDARLKLGYTYYELKQWKSSRKALQTVVKQHPDSSAARLASRFLKRMDKEGH
ncbi:MAG: tol-pal system protein YbgF [Gammaproteobacteria bacterium]